MNSLNFELPVGLYTDGKVYKDVELTKANGVAEKIILTKLPEKPYTWQGNVISAVVKSIGDIEICANVRKEYLTSNSVTIPSKVKELTLADVNTLIVEIHRRVWASKIINQEVICKYCGRKLAMDINLDKIDFSEEQKEEIALNKDYSEIIVDLEGFNVPKSKMTEKAEFAGIDEVVFNRIVFRPPLLNDAIRNEKYANDSVNFWRRIFYDCIVDIQSVEDGKVVDTLPNEFKVWLGMRIFNELLLRNDLHTIREVLLGSIPTLPFAYFEVCGCDQNQQIPVTMDATGFFSE